MKEGSLGSDLVLLLQEIHQLSRSFDLISLLCIHLLSYTYKQWDQDGKAVRNAWTTSIKLLINYLCPHFRPHVPQRVKIEQLVFGGC